MTDDFLERFEQRRQERLQADRTVTIAGVDLIYRPSISPETALLLEETRDRYVSQNGSRDITATHLVNVADQSILECLEPASHQAWANLRDPAAEYPLSLSDVFDLAEYLLGKAAGTPTDAPSGSSDGRTTTAQQSTEDSSSTANAPDSSPSAST